MGFCISENDKKKLPAGKYKVKIDSKLFNGKLEIAEAYIKGKVKKEIFFSTYICHPSMANNETSGIVVLTALLKYLSDNYKNNYYSYRFIFVPETIGSIAYLSKNFKKMKKNIICGLNLSCVGDEKAYSLVKSRFGNSLSDRAIQASLLGFKNFKEYSFLNRGSDERQYCSPGVDLPIASVMRSKYGTYKQYHTSNDDLNFVSPEGLANTFNIYVQILKYIEGKRIYKYNNFLYEPFLTKYSLYPSLGTVHNKNITKDILNFLAYSDGNHDEEEIAKIIKLDIKSVKKIAKTLLNAKLIK